MRRFLFALLLWPLPLLAALPHLDLDVRLEPDTRQIEVSATLSGATGRSYLTLSPIFAIDRLELDGRNIPLASPRRAHGRLSTRAGQKVAGQVRVTYHGRLAALAERDHRQVLDHLPAMAGTEGSFLPAGFAWYPVLGEPFTYRLRLSLPKGQKGLVPGNLIGETEGERYTAEFDFPHPADGIDLMAGPYSVREKLMERADAPPIRLRTWFHAELDGLADGYLEDSARYLARYQDLIGPYPFDAFGVVSSPLPTGFGMPSLTYLGREVLRLPFIRATSLGHEVLHNWWGNGVTPDWQRGNWTEGLTTFLADYAYKEDQSADAAREMRLGWLRDLAAVPEAEDSPLRAFTSRRHGISSIVGYDKSAMVFLMLRDLIGQPAFDAGLRRVWQRHRFGAADWDDLRRAFVEASNCELEGWFAQWLDRPGAPRLTLKDAAWADGRLRFVLEQSTTPYALNVPIRVIYAGRSEDFKVTAGDLRSQIALPLPEAPLAIELDPDYRLWRRIAPGHLPSILREVFVAPAAALLAADEDEALRASARQLAARLLDHPAQETDAPPAGRPLLLIGSHAAVDRQLTRLGLPPRPAEVAAKGTAQAWSGHAPDGHPYAVVSATDAATLDALQRGLPHYGKQSWLWFEGAKATGKGVWPALPERVEVGR